MGSADWMTRNLRHRIEVVFPVYDPEVREEILQMIEIQLSDNTKARILDQNLVNLPTPDHLKPPEKVPNRILSVPEEKIRHPLIIQCVSKGPIYSISV
jgi:polyphosphate kinase